jgi:hypothetical protein
MALPRNGDYSSQSRAMQEAYNKIVDLTSTNPLTIRDIERITGMNYYTIRKYVKDLLAESRLREVGMRERGAVLYSSKFSHLNVWPIIWRNAQRTIGWNLREAIGILRSGGFTTDGLVQHFVLHQEVARIFVRANDLRINHPEAPTKKSLNASRAAFIDALAELEKDVTFLNNIANMDIFWDIEGLNQLHKIEDFPKKDAMKTLEEVIIPETAVIFEQAYNELRSFVTRKSEELAKKQTQSVLLNTSNKEPDNDS